MSTIKSTLTAERLRELLHYDPATGLFTWIGSRNVRVPNGTAAGATRPNKYIAIVLDKRPYYAHRLAWLWTYGSWPEWQIDHIDGDRANNRISNLRDVRPHQNSHNLKRARRGSRSGLIGASPVTWGPYWMARIRVGSRRLYLGTFATPEEAHQAYLKAKREMHTTCTI